MTNYSPLSPTLREILALRNFQAAISEIFGDSNATSSNPNSVRAGLMNAQCVVGELLKALGHSAEHVDKFYMLAEALGDLDVGSVHPLFRGAKHRVLQPTRFAVRPPDTSEKARQRACVVLALIALVSAGRNKQQAATFLAKQHKNISRIAGAKSKNLKATIIEWDKALQSKTVKHPKALDFYDEQAPKIAAQVRALPLEVRQQKAEDLAGRMVEMALGLSLCSNPNEHPGLSPNAEPVIIKGILNSCNTEASSVNHER